MARSREAARGHQFRLERALVVFDSRNQVRLLLFPDERVLIQRVEPLLLLVSRYRQIAGENVSALWLLRRRIQRRELFRVELLESLEVI